MKQCNIILSMNSIPTYINSPQNSNHRTRTNSSTRQTGQSRVTQAETDESWLVRCSPSAMGFSRNNLHDIKHGRQPILLPWGTLWLLSYSPSCLHTRLRFPSEPNPCRFPHRHYQELTPNRNSPPTTHSTVPLFHLGASTRQIPSTCFTPESPLLLFQAYINSP